MYVDASKNLQCDQVETDQRLGFRGPDTMRYKVERLRNSSNLTEEKQEDFKEAAALFAWLQQSTGSEDPVRNIAFSKGVMDASLDCVTRLRSAEQPTQFLGRDAHATIKLFAIDFGATTIALKGQNDLPWCLSNEPLTGPPGDVWSRAGSMFSIWPLPGHESPHDDEHDYLDGYNAVLRSLGTISSASKRQHV